MVSPGRVLALLGAAALLVSTFLPWTGDDLAAIDLGLRSWGDELNQPTLGLLLVVLAAVPSVAALLADRGWPQAVTALGVGGLVVAWLAAGPDGELTSGVIWSIGGAAALLLSSALARGPGAPPPPAAPAPAPPPPAPQPPPPVQRPAEDAASEPTGPDRGHQVVPFVPRPTIEAWGPTRAACFAEALLGSVATLLDPLRLQAESQVAVRVEEDDPARAFVALFRQTVGAAPITGRVPVEVDLFDGPGGSLLGYVATAPLPAGLDVDSLPLSAPEPEVTRSEGTWRCRVTLAG